MSLKMTLAKKITKARSYVEEGCRRQFFRITTGIISLPERARLLYTLAWTGLAAIPWFMQHLFHDAFLLTDYSVFSRQHGTITGIAICIVLDITTFAMFLWHPIKFLSVRRACLKIYSILLLCCVAEIPVTFLFSLR